MHLGCPCHPAVHRRRVAMLQIVDSRGKTRQKGGTTYWPLQPGPASEPSQQASHTRSLTYTHTLPNPPSLDTGFPSLPSVALPCRPLSQRPGADGRLPAAGHAIGLCLQFEKLPASQRPSCPKRHILRIHVMITVEYETARSVRARLKPRLATVASRQQDSTILSPGLTSWVQQHDVALEPTRSPLARRRRMLR